MYVDKNCKSYIKVIKAGYNCINAEIFCRNNQNSDCLASGECLCRLLPAGLRSRHPATPPPRHTPLQFTPLPGPVQSHISAGWRIIPYTVWFLVVFFRNKSDRARVAFAPATIILVFLRVLRWRIYCGCSAVVCRRAGRGGLLGRVGQFHSQSVPVGTIRCRAGENRFLFGGFDIDLLIIMSR